MAEEIDALDRIAMEASQDEQATEAAENAVLNPEPEIDQAHAWAQIPKMFGGILSMALPELKEAYTDDACLQWGSAMSSVAQKYGWDAAETMSRFAPEIALVVATVPLAVPTIAAIKKRKADAEKKGAVLDQVEQVQVQAQPEGVNDGAQ